MNKTVYQFKFSPLFGLKRVFLVSFERTFRGEKGVR